MIRKIRIILIVILLILLFGTCNKVCATIDNPVVLGSVIQLKTDTVGYKDAECKNKKGIAKDGSLARIVVETKNSLGVKVLHKGKLVGCYIKKPACYIVIRGTYNKIIDTRIHKGRYNGYYADLEGDKFILFQQAWYSDVKYWNGTIATDGCAPTAVAIIASGYSKKINPETIVKSQGCWYGSLSKMEQFFRKYAKTKEEVVVVYAGRESENERKKVLKEYLGKGYEAIVNVQDGYIGNKYYSGHYYTILDVEPTTNNVFVADPYRATNGWYHLSELTGIEHMLFIKLNR